MSPKTPAPRRYEINPANYAWYMGLMRKLVGKVGLSIKVHGDKQLLHEGDIFLFNHFARLETVVPHYLIYEETGAYCHPLTHYKLFEVNARLEKFMIEMGCVPSNLPGLMPLLAAEILRGHKVVIYPEGSLIKDRRVMNEAGVFGILSDRDGSFRPLHRGAAALAVTLDLFKARLKLLDDEHLQPWAGQLKMSLEALRTAIAKPTVLVPATITFYPISVDSNFVTRMAGLAMGMVGGKMLGQAAEELVVESNLLLRNTDMDVRLGEAIVVQRESSLWQNLLVERGLDGIKTLDGFFELKDKAAGWFKRLLGRLESAETDRVRDIYTERLYRGVMVNQSHLAARLLTTLAQRKREEVTEEYFQRALYLAIKGAQRAESLYLHRSLIEPGRYRGALDGTNADLARFMAMAVRQGLISREKGRYLLRPRLLIEPPLKTARQENLVAVYANETAPLPALREIIDDALSGAEQVTSKELARLLFDDERRSYKARKAYFTKVRFKEINDKESLRPEAGEPYLLMPSKLVASKNTAVVLVHGFRASPAQLRGFGEKLALRGYTVVGARLAGHGTSPWDLHRRSWEEWLDSVARSYRIARALSDRVILVGFSTGAALSLAYAAQNPEGLAGVVSIAAPLAVQDKNISLVPWVSKLNRLVSGITGNDGVVPFYTNEPDEPEVSYRALPVQAVQELIELMAHLKVELPQVKAPVLVMQGDHDPVVSAESAAKIYGLLGSKDKSLQVIKSERHGILNENVGPTQEMVLGFLKKLAVGDA